MLNANQYIIRKVHMLLIMLIGLAGFATPMSAVGVEISIPSGLQEIGQALNLKSRISALPPGTETQLRSTCLKARILPLETSASYSLEWQSSGVAVEFLPDAVNSGQLQFKSLAPINHALVELELVSSCPLVVFETKWALILDPPALPHAATPPGANLANRGSSPVDKSFDMEQSRMLAMTRQRQVPPGPGALAAWAEPAIQKPAQEKTSFISKGADHQAASTTVTPPANALRVAALGGNALDGGLNQGHTGNAVVDAMTDPLHASLQQSGEGWWFQSYVLPLGLAVLVLSIAVLGQYWSSKRRPESTGSQYPGSEEMDESGGGFEFEAGKAEPVLRHSPERIMQGGTASGMRAGDSPRVLETLLGNACTQPEDVSDFSSTAFFKNQVEGERRTSLAESLEQMNRADLRKWSLPAAYLSLVQARNSSLEVNRTPDALLLRCHVGLVELAYLDALNGQSTTPEVAGELVDNLLGASFHELGLPTPLCVPDLVKSLVRAKMCEVSGQHQRRLLHENLLSLNATAIGPALCFSLPEWQEFLSEEGLLD